MNRIEERAISVELLRRAMEAYEGEIDPDYLLHEGELENGGAWSTVVMKRDRESVEVAIGDDTVRREEKVERVLITAAEFWQDEETRISIDARELNEIMKEAASGMTFDYEVHSRVEI